MPARRTRSGPGPAFTVEVPRALPAERRGDRWRVEVDGRELRLSNLDKVFWPAEGYTKGDLLAYYFNVAPFIVPYLAKRPLTLKRMPDGVEGDFFFEKQAPSHTPDWVPRCAVPASGENARFGPARHEVIDYLMVEDVAGLLYVANLGCVEFHPLHSRCGNVSQPDYLFFDLDPFEPATFADVLAVARHVRAACEQLGLRAYPKTSGATGMQVFVPIEPGRSYEETRALVGAAGRLLAAADPDRVTMEWEIERRAGKVFVDHGMNRAGANIAAVYSLRPEPGAPVSTPLTWDEVEAGEIRPRDFTIATIWERLEHVGDLFRGVLDRPQPLGPALEALGIPRTPPGPVEAATIARSRDSSLRAYLDRRSLGPEGSPEPAGGQPTPEGNAFVVQWHDATRLHHDLRLERGGVLVSWAVPKGLPFVRGERHLAVQTEDHPMEYGSFEGTIPQGHYGAGDVRIWDRGTYELLEWTDDKVSVRLHGLRHGGEYHLVRTKADWLVFLSREDPGRPAPAAPPDLAPMLATAVPAPFDRTGWWFEPKLDGVRTLVELRGQQVRLRSRTGRDQTATYSELAHLERRIVAATALLDGEIVAADERGRPSFERLQERIGLTEPREIQRAARRTPVELYAFDLLWLDGRDLTGLPLTERRAALDGVVLEGRGLRRIYAVEGHGIALFERATELGFEGVVAKRASSRYRPGGRSPDWLKVKAVRRQDCVILGWTPGKGGRGGTFGALLVAARPAPGAPLAWVGQVGTGFTDRALEDLVARLAPLAAGAPAVEDPQLAATRGARWVRPELVCEVQYLEFTRDGKMRGPSFRGLRPDKAPEDCMLEEPAR